MQDIQRQLAAEGLEVDRRALHYLRQLAGHNGAALGAPVLGSQVRSGGEEPPRLGQVAGDLQSGVVGNARALQEVDVDDDAVLLLLLPGVGWHTVE